MAETQGFVQRLKITSGSVLAWAYIGPSPTDTTLLLVLQETGGSAAEIAFRASMAEALSSALASGREVTVTHGDDDATITVVDIETA